MFHSAGLTSMRANLRNGGNATADAPWLASMWNGLVSFRLSSPWNGRLIKL